GFHVTGVQPCALPISVPHGAAAPPSLLRIFSKTPAAEAAANDPRKLTEVDGPWLILAGSFAGSQGREQAERLADELSKQFALATSEGRRIGKDETARG